MSPSLPPVPETARLEPLLHELRILLIDEAGSAADATPQQIEAFARRKLALVSELCPHVERARAKLSGQDAPAGARILAPVAEMRSINHALARFVAIGATMGRRRLAALGLDAAADVYSGGHLSKARFGIEP